jgi:hypothetical protein
VAAAPAADPARAAPPACLDRPPAAAGAAEAIVDPALRPTSFLRPFQPDPPGAVVGPAVDGPTTRQLPPGTPVGTPSPSLHSWQPAPVPGADSAAPPDPPPPGAFMPGGIPGWPLMGGNPCGDPCGAGACCPGATGCGRCGGCGDGCCGSGNAFYVTAEYLLWWIKGSQAPPLVTQGTAAQIFPGSPGPGTLGLPGTTVLFGGRSLEDNPFSGGRFFVGYWLNDEHDLGVEAGVFFLGPHGRHFSAESFGEPILARPITDVSSGSPFETVQLVAGPGVLAGRVDVKSDTKLWGYELNLRRTVLCCCRGSVDLIAGYRGLGLDDRLDINESLVTLMAVPTATGGTIPAGTTFDVNDQFKTENRFYGGQLGLSGEWRFGNWTLGAKGKVALGPTQQIVTINGFTTTTTPLGSPFTAPGGLLALPTNIGRAQRDVFTWVPEVGFNVGYQFTERLRGYVGYDVLYWSSVARASEQVNRTVNTNLVPSSPTAGLGGPAAPLLNFTSREFWAQGVSFGLEFRY